VEKTEKNVEKIEMHCGINGESVGIQPIKIGAWIRNNNFVLIVKNCK